MQRNSPFWEAPHQLASRTKFCGFLYDRITCIHYIDFSIRPNRFGALGFNDVPWAYTCLDVTATVNEKTTSLNPRSSVSVEPAWRFRLTPPVLRLIHHYCDVIMGAFASQITSLTIVYSTLIQAQIKGNIKAPRHWPLCGEFTGNRWIPRTKGL